MTIPASERTLAEYPFGQMTAFTPAPAFRDESDAVL